VCGIYGYQNARYNDKKKTIEFSAVGRYPIELYKTLKSTGLGTVNYVSATYEGPIYIT